MEKLINAGLFIFPMLPYTKKYCPARTDEIAGQDSALKELKSFISDYKTKENQRFSRKQKKKAALVYGPSGTGKTFSVYAIAKELGLEVLEVNASEFRNKDSINQKVGSAVNQHSLFSKGKVILVDEVDGLSGKEDRGGIQALYLLMEKTTFPMILTATNPWDYKFSTLRDKSVLVEFQPLNYLDIFKVLGHICSEEKIKIDDDTLKTLARRAGGDCRAAINNLQTLAYTNEVTKGGIDELAERDQEENIINALLKIFKTTDPKLAIKAFDNVKEDLNEQLLWLDENLPLEYDKPGDLARAYDKLSKADVFNRRIKRWQHWRFLVYINALITAGIAVSKDEKYKKYVQYKPTGRLLKLWWAKQKSMKKKAIAAKIAEHTHSSVREVLKDIEYFKVIFKKNKEMAMAISDELDLDKEEVEWLRK